jgi:hypothetical protein
MACHIPVAVVFLQHFQQAPRPNDPAAGLPLRFSGTTWAISVGFVALAYLFLFTVVHPFVDTRVCVSQIPDPLFALIPYNPIWYRVSHELFYIVTVVGLAGLALTAARGDHRPFLRFGVGIGFQALFRSLTMSLLPLCKVTVAAGQRALESAPTIALGPLRIPWRAWATNDLVFSGHVAEFLILYLAIRSSWPRSARWGLVGFQVLQAIALISTRGHYTVDLVIAVPFAFLADRVAVWLLAMPVRIRQTAH